MKKEIKAVTEKLTVLNRFEEKVKKIEEFVEALKNFDSTLKDIGMSYTYRNIYCCRSIWVYVNVDKNSMI